MNDPVRHKDLCKIQISAELKGIDKPINFYTLADKKTVEKIPKEKLEETIQANISKVSITPMGGGVLKNSISFHYEDLDALKDFDFGNILIQAHLPYCLHIPNFYEMTVSVPDQNLKARVIFEKIWTIRAQTADEKSDTTDYFTDDNVLYFNKSNLITPTMPFRPEEGWDSYFTGRNVEKMRDQNGTFRFTRIYIQFSIDVPENIDTFNKSVENLLSDVQAKALSVVNIIVDNYRYITKENHIRRLGELKVNLVYFIPQNQGYYLLSPNIETAKINRSKKEFTDLAKRLDQGERPKIHELLLMDARSSFDTKDYTLAIVESFQALEIFIENYLIQCFKERGDSESDYKKILKTHWQTKERLNEVLKELKGKALNGQGIIWDKWCTSYDKTRNEVIHTGKPPTEEETERTLSINEEVVNWVLNI